MASEMLYKPLEIDVEFASLGRKLSSAPPDVLTLTLSKEGAERALFLAEGHICMIPNFESLEDTLFEVVSVKPWSSSLELRTCEQIPHKLSNQDLADGGKVRVRLGASPVEEAATMAMRLSDMTGKKCLQLDALVQKMKEICDLPEEVFGDGGETAPEWLAKSTCFASWASAKGGRLVKPRGPIAEGGRTPLERTVAVLLAPMTRRGPDQNADPPGIDSLLERLQGVMPQTADEKLPPLADRGVFRHFLEASPSLSLEESEQGEELVVMADRAGQASPPPTPISSGEPPAAPAAPSPKDPPKVEEKAQQARETKGRSQESTSANPPARSLREADPLPSSSGRPATRDTAPVKKGERRFGKAMKALDELGKLLADSLRLSRNKPRISGSCIGAATGGLSRPDDRVTCDLLEVLEGLPGAIQRCQDELEAAKEQEGALPALDDGMLDFWSSGLEEHRHRVEDVRQLLVDPGPEAEARTEEIESSLVRVRHGFRDAQREVIDPALASLTDALRAAGPPGATSAPPPGRTGRPRAEDDRPVRESREDLRQRSPRRDPGPSKGKSRGKERGGRLADDWEAAPRRYEGHSNGHAPHHQDRAAAPPPRRQLARREWDEPAYEDRPQERAPGKGGSQARSRRAPVESRSRSPLPGKGASAPPPAPPKVPPEAAALTPAEIELNVEGLYEVKSSEGPWYPGVILRQRRSGRFEADLVGGGCAVFYPSVDISEIRLAPAPPRRGAATRQKAVDSRVSAAADRRPDSRPRSGRAPPSLASRSSLRENFEPASRGDRAWAGRPGSWHHR
eukprot:TRINITY_DN29744_c0_g1_i1.p1 TRINITY_DN29744_c0_g1~~TRINITY_DN29744_c0_g1_i1.p1  ORF type:complete len:797 (-),score=146.14 TRINITY_DN29744_c0_g1_i1:24-2414(-)